MRRQDYFGQGSRGWLRLDERGGRRHDVLAHHRVAAALDAYVEAAGLEEPKAALFQTVDPAGRRLTGRALDRRLVLAMIKRRAAGAGLPPSTCCHTFRATGITAYLSNGGTLERAQQIAGHASPKTTKLYDRTADTVTVDERAYRDLNRSGGRQKADSGSVAPEVGVDASSPSLRRRLRTETRTTACWWRGRTVAGSSAARRPSTLRSPALRRISGSYSTRPGGGPEAPPRGGCDRGTPASAWAGVNSALVSARATACVSSMRPTVKQHLAAIRMLGDWLRRQPGPSR